MRFCDKMSLEGNQTLGDAEAKGATTAKALIAAASTNDISTHKLIRWFDLISRAGSAIPANQPLTNSLLDEEQYLDFEQKMAFTFWRSATFAAAAILGADGYREKY
jgi:hypothetical protein